MTIKRKRTNGSGLVEVEADSTDTVDTLGTIAEQTAVGAKSAKFSDASDMKANVGKALGVLKAVLNSGDEIKPRTTSIHSASGWSGSGANIVDENLGTAATNATFPSEVIVDFGSVDTNVLRVKVGDPYGGGSISSKTYDVEISDDDVTYTPIGSTITVPKNSEVDQSFGSQTFRYVKVKYTGGTNAGLSSGEIFEVYEEPAVTSETTVRFRSSVSKDGTDGTVISSNIVLGENDSVTEDDDLMLVVTGGYFTLEIVSIAGFALPIDVDTITSILEV